jgi:TonB family protein
MDVRAGLLLLFLTFPVALLPLQAATGDRALLRKATPVYPELARRMHIYGSIRLLVSISPGGEVGEILVESGHPLLIEAAEDAVKQWKFAVGPTATTASVVVRFDLP